MTRSEPRWRKSTASSTTSCVEVAAVGDSVLVRDTKNRDAATLRFTSDEWQQFVAAASAGEFSLPRLRNS
jgi:uncharacterized protein DUF397